MTVAVISQKTRGDVDRFAKFFGIDLEWNRGVFSYAARADGEAFSKVMALFSEAIEQDRRFGVEDRIRARILAEKESEKVGRK